MGSKTLSIGEKASRHLKRLKRPKESFTEVILRLAGRGDLTRFSGTISAEFAEDLRGGSTGRALSMGVGAQPGPRLMLILDTSFVIDFLQGDEDASKSCACSRKAAQP